MKKSLTKIKKDLNENLRGDCTGLEGNCTGLVGDIDRCSISKEERGQGIDILKLIK